MSCFSSEKKVFVGSLLMECSDLQYSTYFVQFLEPELLNWKTRFYRGGR